jgi:hypothetical protein
MHNLFTSLTPLPILLILDPSGLSAADSDALPISVYESIPAAGSVELGQVEYRLETGEAERIGVEYVTSTQGKIGQEQTDSDERILLRLRWLIVVVSVLTTQASAIRLLKTRIETIKNYLVECQGGTTSQIVKLTVRKTHSRRDSPERNLVTTIPSPSNFIALLRKRIRSLLGRRPPRLPLHRNPQRHKRHPRRPPILTPALTQLNHKINVTTETRRKRVGMAARLGRGKGAFGELDIRPYIPLAWKNGRE